MTATRYSTEIKAASYDTDFDYPAPHEIEDQVLPCSRQGRKACTLTIPYSGFEIAIIQEKSTTYNIPLNRLKAKEVELAELIDTENISEFLSEHDLIDSLLESPVAINDISYIACGVTDTVQTQSWLREYWDLTGAYAIAWNKIEEVSVNLVNQVERLAPGDRFGVGKHMHMRELAFEGVLSSAIEHELNPIEALTLSLALRTHDLGRHAEVIADKTPGTATITHGDHAAESVRILKENNILDDFPEDVREAVYLAVEFHVDKRKDLSANPLAEKIHKILCGLDFFDLADKKYISASEAKIQVGKWYTPDEAKRPEQVNQIDPAFFPNGQRESELDAVLSKCLEPHADFDSIEMESDLREQLAAVLRTPPSNEIVDYFLQEEPFTELSKDSGYFAKAVHHSYPAYMLMQISLMKNQDISTVRACYRENTMFERMRFIYDSFPSQDKQKAFEIARAVDRFYKEKLGLDSVEEEHSLEIDLMHYLESDLREQDNLEPHWTELTKLHYKVVIIPSQRNTRCTSDFGRGLVAREMLEEEIRALPPNPKILWVGLGLEDFKNVSDEDSAVNSNNPGPRLAQFCALLEKEKGDDYELTILECDQLPIGGLKDYSVNFNFGLYGEIDLYKNTLDDYLTLVGLTKSELSSVDGKYTIPIPRGLAGKIRESQVGIINDDVVLADLTSYRDYFDFVHCTNVLEHVCGYDWSPAGTLALSNIESVINSRGRLFTNGKGRHHEERGYFIDPSWVVKHVMQGKTNLKLVHEIGDLHEQKTGRLASHFIFSKEA